MDFFFRFSDLVLSASTSSHQPVLGKLQQAFAYLRHTLRALYSPSDFLKSARPPWFGSGRQQDCSEFLRYLLDTLIEQEKSGKSGNFSIFREHRVIEPPGIKTSPPSGSGNESGSNPAEEDMPDAKDSSLTASTTGIFYFLFLCINVIYWFPAL